MARTEMTLEAPVPRSLVVRVVELLAVSGERTLQPQRKVVPHGVTTVFPEQELEWGPAVTVAPTTRSTHRVVAVAVTPAVAAAQVLALTIRAVAVAAAVRAGSWLPRLSLQRTQLQDLWQLPG